MEAAIPVLNYPGPGATAAPRREQILRACICVLAVLIVAAFGIDLWLAAQRLPLNSREGWNAYHAANAFGRALYPRLPALMYNNYPPLSFLLTGAIGRLMGDNIVAGRLLALTSTAVAALCVYRISRSMAVSRMEALLSAALFLASPWLLSQFAGIDDPEMLGLALGCLGFAVILRQSGPRRAVGMSALLMTMACFVKPLFVIQPLALLIWLAMDEKPNVVRFALSGLTAAIAGIITIWLVFGINLFEHVLSARVFDISGTVSHPGTWLLTGIVPLMATVSLWYVHGDKYARLCAIYGTVAVLLGMFFSGGEGVGGNATFDMSIAASLGAGVFMNRAGRGTAVPQWLAAWRGSAVAVIAALSLAIDLAAQMTQLFLPITSAGVQLADSIPAQREEVQRDTGFLRATPGRAFCETLALCYWAGKAPEIDAFNLTQAFKRHARSTDELVKLLDMRPYKLVELDRRSHFGYSHILRCAFARNYQVDHADGLGVFLAPRNEASVSRRFSPGPCPGDLDRYLVGTMN